MKERCNDDKLKRALAYLDKDLEILKEILEIGEGEDPADNNSLYMAMHYQFRAKLAARHLDKEECKACYEKSEAIFLRAYEGKRSLVLQSFYQFIIDDYAELAMEDEAMMYNKLYKQTLKQYYDKDNLFYIAYTIDIVAQEMQTKPMKAFYKVKRAQKVIEPIIGKDSLIGLIFQLFEGLKDMFTKETQNKGFKTMKYVE